MNSLADSHLLSLNTAWNQKYLPIYRCLFRTLGCFFLVFEHCSAFITDDGKSRGIEENIDKTSSDFKFSSSQYWRWICVWRELYRNNYIYHHNMSFFFWFHIKKDNNFRFLSIFSHFAVLLLFWLFCRIVGKIQIEKHTTFALLRQGEMREMLCWPTNFEKWFSDMTDISWH